MQKRDNSPKKNNQKQTNPGSKNVSLSLTSKPVKKPSSTSAPPSNTISCSSCNQKIPMQELTKHHLTCSHQTRKCYIGRCTYVGLTDEFLEHIRLDHAQDLLSAFAKDLPSNEIKESKSVNDLIAFKKNRAGREAKLGESGKYYCRGRLNGPCHNNGWSGCCDGYCGPTNGCNCRACMELDIDSRKLPKEYWINRTGMICTKGGDGKVHCGRKLYWGNSGQCEPIQGQQCGGCESLQFQLAERYQGLNFY